MNEPGAGDRRVLAGGLDGVVLLDKPVGLSSNVALQKVKRLFGTRKAGHTGSLDPLASGLLPICLGQATRFSGYLLDAAKAYRVAGLLGTRTSTGDAEGEAVERCEWSHLQRESFETVLADFRGPIRQVPPMYSALKQGGERLYRKARRGETVRTRAARHGDLCARTRAVGAARVCAGCTLLQGHLCSVAGGRRGPCGRQLRTRHRPEALCRGAVRRARHAHAGRARGDSRQWN
jgi:hypothetical protein